MKVYGNYNNIFAKLNQGCNGHQNRNNKNSNGTVCNSNFGSNGGKFIKRRKYGNCK